MFYSDAPVLLVSGGKGGVGKSSVSAGIANALCAKGFRMGVLDADLTGPSQSVLFPGEMRAEGSLLVPAACGNISVCSMGYLSEDPSALVWSEDAARSLFERFLFKTEWGRLDVLVVDLPPTSGTTTRVLMEFFERASTVFVTTESQLALADCRRDVTFHRKLENNAVGIIHNMAYHECGACGARQPIGASDELDAFARDAGLPVLARLPYCDTIADGEALAEVASCIAERKEFLHA